MNREYTMQLGEKMLQILPENLKEVLSGDNKKYDTLKGERVVAGDIKLHTWTMSSYFPADGKISPKDYKDYYEKVMKDKKEIAFNILRWLVDGTGTFKTMASVIFDSIEWEDRVGEPGDLYFTFKLVEFKKFGSKKVG